MAVRLVTFRPSDPPFYKAVEDIEVPLSGASAGMPARDFNFDLVEMAQT